MNIPALKGIIDSAGIENLQNMITADDTRK
jgi:hypothetical protein